MVEEVTLGHWQHHSGGRAAAVESFKEQFEADNPNVTIDFQSIPWAEYWGKLAAGIAGGAGSAPDIFQIPMGLVEEYIAGDSLLPVAESVITPSQIAADYLPWTVARGSKGGEYYGLPLDVQTLVMYRNNALYESAGLDPSAPYADHSDMYEQAVAMTKLEGGDDDQIGINTGYYSAFQTILYQQFLQREQNGQPWVDESTNQLVWNDYPEVLQTFEWFCDLSGTADDNSFLQGQSRFALGRAASEIGHPVSRGSLAQQAPDLEYTIVPFPVRSVGQEQYTAGSHWMWVVGKWVPDSEVGWQWVHYCTNKDAQVIWNDVAGDLPSFQGLGQEARFRPDANAEVCLDSLEFATPWEWVGWAEWVKELGDGRDRVVIGGEDTATSFNTMVENLNGVIADHTV
jgi:multiple sugar transport system substrate-binding protein